MFKVKTYDELLKECLDNAPDGIDTRQGSIFYDACAAACLIIAEMYSQQNTFSDMCHIDTAVGEYLDSCGADHGVTRQEAVPLRCRAEFIGVQPDIGARFFYDGIFFVLKDDLDLLYPDDEALIAKGTVYLEAEKAGIEANVVEVGVSLVPYNDIPGLESAIITEIIIDGSDEEDDESYRERMQNKIGGPAENGNKYHYKKWCEECPGVGSITARIFPLAVVSAANTLKYNCPNNVTGVLLTDEGKAVEPSVVNLVQKYVDPGSEGLGEGVANMGSHFHAVAAYQHEFYIKVEVELKSSAYTIGDAKAEIKTIAENYLKEIALEPLSFVETDEGSRAENIKIRIKKLGALIAQADSIADYDNLEIRLGEDYYYATNLEMEPNCVAVVFDDTVFVSEMGSTEATEQ